MRNNLVSSKQMILCNVYGKELGQFSSKEVAGMLSCSQCANNKAINQWTGATPGRRPVWESNGGSQTRLWQDDRNC